MSIWQNGLLMLVGKEKTYTIKYLYLVLRISVCGVSLIKKNDSNSFYEHPAV